jgi:tetratricopeptide (TPR) repeat protein
MILLWALLAQSEGCPALLDRGRKAYEAREFVRAVGEFERALPLCRNRGQVLLALGQAQLLAQRIEAGIATLREATALEPHDAMAHKLLGDALYLSGQEIEAEKFFKAALAIDSRHEATLYALGRVYYQQKRYPEAVRQFQQVLEENPASYRAHDNLALCYDALRQDSDALRHFFKALDLVHKDHPEYDWAYANLADFYLRRDQYEKAFHLAAEAAHRNPESARNCFLTGKALVRLDKQELSLRWLRQAVKLDPSYSEARYLLAQVYRKLGREEEALQELEKFRELREEPRPRR